MTRRFPAVAGAAALAAALLLSATACSSSDDDKTSEDVADTPIPAAASVGDIPDLQARWWGWAAAQPTATHPVLDDTGAHCAVGQGGDVWFVAGTLGGEAKRACTVPAGRTIAGPLLNVTTDTPAACTDFIASADGEVILDGAPVDVKKIEPEAVTFTAVAGNPFTKEAGEVAKQGCGLWFALAPLQPGVHKLNIHGVSDVYKTSVEYTLTVTA
ncbi:signal protein [Yinghuangia soli]|uniref:Signal protein n=1 Tax=Yinghuangia soli TaxID=2908204 RepID=A0AA41Q463_9ACTN|nr:signal protein [Yinghuangia soli]MCF2530660.1 signal protein [Yinghuangia soli]